MLVVIVVNCIVVTLAVLNHYEFLFRMSVLIPRMRVKHRFRIVLGVFGALTAHTVEIWLFAVAFFFLDKLGWGHLSGNFHGRLMDAGYFSFTTYTTLGFGDIAPVGDLRYLAGLEALTGLVLITWTASFLYYEMEKYWDSH